MDVVIRGKNVKVSESLRTAADGAPGQARPFRQRVRPGGGGLLRGAEPPHRRQPEVRGARPREGPPPQGPRLGQEPFAALYAVCDKVEHQVKRLKDKRVARPTPSGSARSGSSCRPSKTTRRTSRTAQTARIVKTKEFTIKPMTAEEAVLQMDLLGHDFFLFTSSETGRAAVIYRRNDGNFGLIETAG